MPGLGSHGKGVHPSGQNVKKRMGDLGECSQNLLQQHTVSSQHSLSGPEPELTQVKAATKKEQKGITPIPFPNPDLVAWLVGHANKVPVVIDGCKVAVLIDLGAQVSNISAQLCKHLGLKIQPLGWLLELKGTGGAAIPYLRFVEVNLQILGIRSYHEDVLLLAIPTTAYAEEVLVMVSSKIIDRALSCMTTGELAHGTATWWQAHFRAVMFGLLQLSCSSSDKPKQGEKLKNFSWENDPVEVWKSQLDGVKGAVHTTQKVTIPPFHTIKVGANTSIKGHCMKVHILTEPVLGPQLPAAVVPIATYGELHLGSSRVPVCLHNLSAHAVEIPAKTVVGQVIPANQVPPVVHPTRTAKETVTKVPKGWVFEALDLQGLKEWPEPEQKQARELLLKWEQLFAHSDLDLGKTALIKHKIRLTEQMPYKKQYWQIPPHMYNDVRAHIQEMLDIGAILKSHSLWVSAVVLVWKKDGGLRFCIDLRKLNEWTIKDAYSLPRIEKTLDSLQGSQWFSSLDLKSGYWQVKMDEESKPLTAFTVGPLGFYECKRMPFGLTNAPPMFQRLMETCLGDLNLHWCIIYLDDIVIFSKDLASHLKRLKAVFQKLEEAGLKLKPSKCELFLRHLAYLCWRSSHWWRQDWGYQELAHTY